MPSHEEHRAKSLKSISIALVIVSSSRYALKQKGNDVEDPSGTLAKSIIERHGHKLCYYRIVDDNIKMIREETSALVHNRKVNAIILIGGTGLAKRDVTIEAITPLLEKQMDGFGEIFRYESYRKVGTPAYLTRAVAGVVSGKLVYCLPGSIDAVKTAMNLIMPEIAHALYIART